MGCFPDAPAQAKTPGLRVFNGYGDMFLRTRGSPILGLRLNVGFKRQLDGNLRTINHSSSKFTWKFDFPFRLEAEVRHALDSLRAMVGAAVRIQHKDIDDNIILDKVCYILEQKPNVRRSDKQRWTMSLTFEEYDPAT